MTRNRKRRLKGAAHRSPPSSGLPAIVGLTPRRARVLWMLCGLGFAICVYLTYVHYRLHVAPEWRSACDLNVEFSCDAVLLSPFGSIKGLPLSLVGAWFYFIVCVIVGAGARWKFVRSPGFVVFTCGAIATAASVALAAISLTSVGAMCPLCIALYAVNMAMTATAWGAVRASGETIARAAHLERVYWRAKLLQLAVGFIAAAALLGVCAAIYSRSPGASSICEAVARSATSDRSITLEIYSDFQCPHCRDVARSLRPILLDQKGGIHVQHHHYPLDSACNPRAKRSRHPGSCRLASAAICASAQGKYAEFSDALFSKSSSESVDSVAASLGLDSNAIEACITTDDTRRSLRADVDAAIALGVHATPTLFLDGSRHVGRLREGDLRCLSKAASWTPTDR